MESLRYKGVLKILGNFILVTKVLEFNVYQLVNPIQTGRFKDLKKSFSIVTC